MKAALIALALLATSSIANAWTITVTGTIYQQGSLPANQIGVFGPAGISLVGSTYTETISTDPSQNTIDASNPPAYNFRYSPTPGGAPFVVSVTINGVTFIDTESNPWGNSLEVASGIANGLSQDAINEVVYSAGCSSSYGRCISSYILAYSYGPSFVPGIDFNQSILATALNLDPGSNTYFLFRDGPTIQGSIQQYTGFYGSIDTISVNVPEPMTWALLLFGFAFLGMREIWPGAEHE